MTKIAVCLSGHPRTFERTAQKIKESLGEADFYFSTWSSDYNDTLLSVFSQHDINLVAYEFISEPLQIENERKILSDFTDSYPDFFILNQWFGVKRVIQLMQDYSQAMLKEYDIVIRCRFDLSCDFTKEQLLSSFKPDAFNYAKSLTGGSDQFLFGSPQVMGSFLNFEKWLLEFSTKFDPRHGFFASLLVKAYFLDLKIPTNRVDLKLHVLRLEKSSAKLAREQRTREYIAKHFPEFDGLAWSGERNVENILKPGPWDKGFGGNKALIYVDGKNSQ
ncbi:hypothetical protein J2W83_004342 [Pseudomonas hunanensis]|uniref:Uncharacterized protein n=1 Tax=Pseudomonas hunanensis TaxID=1247546 RepID=A0ACC6K8I1_9PSED|nr:hypothetical protein [Pseudomonas hunanensis]MDR6714706.1 hypothetical protein [Pseudomonas hunanensis]